MRERERWMNGEGKERKDGQGGNGMLLYHHPSSFWAVFVWFLFLPGASLLLIRPFFLITDLFTKELGR
jgi:hypothetical protein